jgi:hypothetical protein
LTPVGAAPPVCSPTVDPAEVRPVGRGRSHR